MRAHGIRRRGAIRRRGYATDEYEPAAPNTTHNMNHYTGPTAQTATAVAPDAFSVTYGHTVNLLMKQRSVVDACAHALRSSSVPPDRAKLNNPPAQLANERLQR